MSFRFRRFPLIAKEKFAVVPATVEAARAAGMLRARLPIDIDASTRTSLRTVGSTGRLGSGSTATMPSPAQDWFEQPFGAARDCARRRLEAGDLAMM